MSTIKYCKSIEKATIPYFYANITVCQTTYFLLFLHFGIEMENVPNPYAKKVERRQKFENYVNRL